MQRNCGAICGCRKAGMKCSAVCFHCSGETCSSVMELSELINENDFDDEPPTLTPLPSPVLPLVFNSETRSDAEPQPGTRRVIAEIANRRYVDGRRERRASEYGGVVTAARRLLIADNVIYDAEILLVSPSRIAFAPITAPCDGPGASGAATLATGDCFSVCADAD
ncbi:hypothetical protein EVAR_88505_1 [Eumeta japonica]|uniref:Tesmin/TSO1-like CXC domain-containing protein n=1 Tax=Eumeta variegata TaxID=151549 RepID=A0A4C1XW75_EUMVA|nr:hypothetical protein EVAR_88505_1 [Eumeta japonica]